MRHAGSALILGLTLLMAWPAAAQSRVEQAAHDYQDVLAGRVHLSDLPPGQQADVIALDQEFRRTEARSAVPQDCRHPPANMTQLEQALHDLRCH